MNLYEGINNNLKESASNAEQKIKKYVNADDETLENDDISDYDAYDWLLEVVKKYPNNKAANDFIAEVENKKKEEPDENPFEILDYGTFDILDIAYNVIDDTEKEVVDDTWRIDYDTLNDCRYKYYASEEEARKAFSKMVKNPNLSCIRLFKKGRIVNNTDGKVENDIKFTREDLQNPYLLKVTFKDGTTYTKNFNSLEAGNNAAGKYLKNKNNNIKYVTLTYILTDNDILFYNFD